MQNFEQASKRLEEILEILSGEEASLEASLELYSEAAEHIKFCNSFLNKAQLKIEEIDAKLKLEDENE